jgi:hypothetical protein
MLDPANVLLKAEVVIDEEHCIVKTFASDRGDQLQSVDIDPVPEFTRMGASNDPQGGAWQVGPNDAHR